MRPGELRGRNQRGPTKTDKHAVNNEISASEVRVIGAEGEQLGVLPLREAITIAEDLGLDLVQVAGDASPPVCKIIDYGKLRYREQKKAAETRKKSSSQATKELRLRYSTDSHDIETKVRNARKFLMEGDKVKFEMRFKGREVVYQDLGRETLKQIIGMLEDIAIVEELTPLLGTKMILNVSPKAGRSATA